MDAKRYGNSFYEMITSSGTALTLVNPFLKTTNTLLAPHLKAEVAQSKAVSPAPSTITLPRREGNALLLHAHIPGLLPAVTFGRKLFDVKNPISSVRSEKIGMVFASGRPSPKKTAL